MKQTKRLVGYDPDKIMTPDQLEDFLEQQVNSDLESALIQDYLAGFGYKMIWRIILATDEDLDELKAKGKGWL